MCVPSASFFSLCELDVSRCVCVCVCRAFAILLKNEMLYGHLHMSITPRQLVCWEPHQPHSRDLPTPSTPGIHTRAHHHILDACAVNVCMLSHVLVCLDLDGGWRFARGATVDGRGGPLQQADGHQRQTRASIETRDTRGPGRQGFDGVGGNACGQDVNAIHTRSNSNLVKFER